MKRRKRPSDELISKIFPLNKNDINQLLSVYSEYYQYMRLCTSNKDQWMNTAKQNELCTANKRSQWAEYWVDFQKRKRKKRSVQTKTFIAIVINQRNALEHKAPTIEDFIFHIQVTRHKSKPKESPESLTTERQRRPKNESERIVYLVVDGDCNWNRKTKLNRKKNKNKKPNRIQYRM